VDQENHGPLCIGGEVAGVVHEGLNLVTVATCVPEVGGGVGEQACELGVYFMGTEEDVRLAVWTLRVPDLGGPDRGCRNERLARW
jgi:hypothetical protein